jgi:pilus assembly protein CpaE
VARPAIVVALPATESESVVAELAGAGFEVFEVHGPAQLETILSQRSDVAVAILDGETDFDESLEYYAALHDGEASIPALMVVSADSFDRLAGHSDAVEDEYLTRPFTPDSIRWRVEAMCIRRTTVDDGSGPILHDATVQMEGWTDRSGTIVVVFNPKGGVGKTTVATNLAAAIQQRGDQRVLLVDADTVTGHILTSLGLDAATTLADAWRDELEMNETAPAIASLAAEHPSGMRVLALTNSPLHVDVLDPERVANAIEGARRSFDVVVVDLHPSYSALNRAIFGIADRILVPVTPDVPAIRAAIQLRDVAVDLGIRERLAMVVNRANSGVSVEDMERTVGMSATALIRSGGMLFVRAANEGRTVIEKFPKEKVADDFLTLRDRLMTPVTSAEAIEKAAAPKAGFRLFNRTKEPVRA